MKDPEREPRPAAQGQSIQSFTKSAVAMVATNSAGVALAFVCQMVLARILGADAFGAYTWILSFLSLLALPAVQGLDSATLRFVAIYQGRGESDRVVKFFLFAWRRVVVASAVIALALMASGSAAWQMRSAPDRISIALAALLLVANALGGLTTATLQAVGRAAAAQAAQVLVRPALCAGLVAGATLLFAAPRSVSLALGANLIASLAVLAFARFLLSGRLPPRRNRERAAPEFRQLWGRTAFPLGLVSGLQVVITRADIVLVGILVDATAAGFYAMASTLASVVTLPITAVNTVLAPAIADAHAAGRRDELQRTMTWAARIVFALTAPGIALLVLIGTRLLDLFGPGFAQAYPVMVVLVVGQAGVAFAGSVGFLLTMTGHQRDAARVLGGSAVAAVALPFLLVPHFGIVGAAIGTCLATLARTFALASLARRRLGIHATALGFPRSMTRVGPPG